jgi:hypothetical protein
VDYLARRSRRRSMITGVLFLDLLVCQCSMQWASMWASSIWLLNHPSVWFAQLGQLGLALIVGLYRGSEPAILVEAEPPKVRCTAVALGYNVSAGMIGEVTPLVASWLVARTGDEIAPGFLMMVAAAVTFLTILRFPETYRTPFVGIMSRATASYA